MDKLSISIREDKTAFAPHEAIEGAIQWNLDANPRHLELSLFWYTSGKGTRDVGVVETVTVENPGAFGSRDFSFALPEGPYSFSGKLISLIWAVELSCSPGAETVRREIVLSPAGEELVLGVVASQGRFAWGEKGPGHNPLGRLLGVRR